tara:strand:- start:536 stop:748 length:213 start_codon:yes stop_codon:yes gene_type:complete
MPKKKNNYDEDKCPVCNRDLYFNDVVTQKIGIVDYDGDVSEWKCPFCNSEFDLEDNILYIYGSESDRGLA